MVIGLIPHHITIYYVITFLCEPCLWNNSCVLHYLNVMLQISLNNYLFKQLSYKYKRKHRTYIDYPTIVPQCRFKFLLFYHIGRIYTLDVYCVDDTLWKVRIKCIHMNIQKYIHVCALCVHLFVSGCKTVLMRSTEHWTAAAAAARAAHSHRSQPRAHHLIRVFPPTNFLMCAMTTTTTTILYYMFIE